MHDPVTDPIWDTPLPEWPDALAALALPHVMFSLDPDDAALWEDVAAGRRIGVRAEDFSDGFHADLGACLEAFPEGAHLKLDLCSLKHGAQVPRVYTPADALAVISRANGRVAAAWNSRQPRPGGSPDDAAWALIQAPRIFCGGRPGTATRVRTSSR